MTTTYGTELVDLLVKLMDLKRKRETDEIFGNKKLVDEADIEIIEVEKKLEVLNVKIKRMIEEELNVFS